MQDRSRTSHDHLKDQQRRQGGNDDHDNNIVRDQEQRNAAYDQQQRHQSQHRQPQREPFFRFFSSPNVNHHHHSITAGTAGDDSVRAKLEPLNSAATLSTSPQGHHQGMANYSYSAMARLSIASDGKDVEQGKEGRLPSIFANGEYGGREDTVSRFGLPGLAHERSPSGSGGSSPNLVSVREIQESDDGHGARSRRRSGLYSPSQAGREDGLISLPPLRHGFAPSSPGGSSSNHNHSESNSNYLREEGSRVTGPQRTGRPHSQSVSSMITSPYSHSATPSTSSLLLPSPSGLSNLRPSFAYSPPRANKTPLTGPASARGNEFPRLERHISSSSLPGESSGFLRPHHSFFPGGGLNGMFTSRSGNDSHSHQTTQGQVQGQDSSAGESIPQTVSPAPVTARRGNIERLFRAATTRKKRSGSDANKPKGVLMMTEIKDDADEQLEGLSEGDVKDAKDLDPSAVRRLAHLQCEQRRRESINGGFATLRSILPETTAADSKAAILQKAINYIQNLEQAVRVAGGRLDPGMTQMPNPSNQARPQKRRSTLSTSYSEAMSYPDETASGVNVASGRGRETASSSTTDLVGGNTDKENYNDDDETMRMDMDVQDDMAMAMSDDDEAELRKRGYSRSNGSSGTVPEPQYHQHHRYQEPQQPQRDYHPNHHTQPPPSQTQTSTGGGHKKGGFSPLDLLVGVAEQARRVTGTGNHSKSHAHVDSAGNHHGHGLVGNNHIVNGSVGTNGLPVVAGEKLVKTGTRGSWAHIEVGDGR